MIILNIDSSSPYWVQTTTLEKRQYDLEFRYSVLESRFYLSIGLTTQPGVWLASGIAVVTNYNLLYGLASTDLPNGVLFCGVVGTDTSPPKLGEIGNPLTDDLRCYLAFEAAA